MSAVADPVPRVGVANRAWGVIVGAWGVVTGLAPHVLHHVGPLAGAAVLAGVGGNILFFVLGLALSIPLLRRLYRRFGTLIAPAIAIVVFAGTFALSSLVIAPRITGGSDTPAQSRPALQQPSGHDAHHDSSD